MPKGKFDATQSFTQASNPLSGPVQCPAPTSSMRSITADYTLAAQAIKGVQMLLRVLHKLVIPCRASSHSCTEITHERNSRRLIAAGVCLPSATCFGCQSPPENSACFFHASTSLSASSEFVRMRLGLLPDQVNSDI